MGRLIVIEGLDGAGKATLAGGLADELGGRGISVARLAFPRYGVDVHADLVREAMYGEHGDLPGSAYGMAVLFALDRAAAADELRATLAAHDVALIDRYVASNAAYGAARLGQSVDGEFVRWLHALEIDRFGLPVPDLQLLLDVPVATAAARAGHRERADGRDRDDWESDLSLQQRCALVYRRLADVDWLGPWRVLNGQSNVDCSALVDDLLAADFVRG